MAIQLGCIGGGNMGGALVQGLAAGGMAPGQITVVDPDEGRCAALAAAGFSTSTSLNEAIEGREMVVLAVKPQLAASVLDAAVGLLKPAQILVSVMAGVRTGTIEAQLRGPVPVVRAMPQTLIRIGAGATALCAGAHATAEHLERVAALFGQAGTTVAVSEAQMDAVTGLSGSGPAYVYTIIEALADGGVRAGLTRDTAVKLAAQTLAGAAQMVLQGAGHPAALRDQVTSPGGTTIAGLHVLEANGVRAALMSAVLAASERSAELGRA